MQDPSRSAPTSRALPRRARSPLAPRAATALAALAALGALAAPTPARAQQGGGAPRAEGPPATSLGSLVCEATRVRYRLTPEDAVWAARMIVGEAGGKDDKDSEAVLWCMLNSYALRPVRDTYPTFTAFVRAYCTPLQPYLKAQGAIDRHRRRGTKMVEVEPGRWQLERHVQLQARPWSELPESARTLVTRVMSGAIENPCGNATQFCSTAVYFHDANGRKPSAEEHAAFTESYAAKKGWVWWKPEGTNPMRNCFFEEKRFASLPRPAARVAAAEGR